MDTDPSRTHTKTFDWASNTEFAWFSGDRNPIHVDPVAARRTQAGSPVVMGMHAILWALEALTRQGLITQTIGHLKATFHKMIYIGDEVRLEVSRVDAKGIRAQMSVGNLTVSTMQIKWGEPEGSGFMPPQNLPPIEYPEHPLCPSLEDCRDSSGWLRFARSIEAANAFFPALTNVLGANRVSALGCMSRLVGMVSPGLNSVFSSLNLCLVDFEGPEAIHFSVSDVEERFRLINQTVSGGGWKGNIECFMRLPPVEQASVEQISKFVMKDQFQQVRALVIGGSRGLGELTAKIIAAGGGDVNITYTVGLQEAQNVQEEIKRRGGRCTILQYDACKPAADQLVELQSPITSIYYFATPFIGRPHVDVYDQTSLNTFMAVYVQGFYELVQRALQLSDKRLNVFYPSTSFLESRPEGMTEYTMAKAAGEVLCADMQQAEKRLRVFVSRLPPLLTDQTASVVLGDVAEPLDAMLRIVKRVEK